MSCEVYMVHSNTIKKDSMVCNITITITLSHFLPFYDKDIYFLLKNPSKPQFEFFLSYSKPIAYPLTNPVENLYRR